MSEIKVSCPNCDQHIACDESYYGVQINCPTCGTAIQVPFAEAPDDGGSAGSVPSANPSPAGLRMANPKPAATAFHKARPTPGQQNRRLASSRPDNNAWLITWLLSFFLGGFGIDRFYNGRIKLGIGKLLASLLTCGAIGLVWAMIDIILLLAGKYQDAQGNYLKRPQGKYMTLQVLGIFFAALFGIACVLYAFWIISLTIVLTSHSNFGSSQNGLAPAGFTLNGSAQGVTPPQDTSGPTVTTLLEWNQLQGPMMRTVTVIGGAPECPTGIMLTGKDQYQLYPCPTDTWNARPRRGQNAGWSDVDYRGHVEVEDRTASDRPYLQLCYRIGDGELQAVQMGGIVSGRGLLVLVPNHDGGRGIPTGPIRVPTGSIRVKIVKVYSAQNNQPREAAEQPQNF